MRLLEKNPLRFGFLDFRFSAPGLSPPWPWSLCHPLSLRACMCERKNPIKTLPTGGGRIRGKRRKLQRVYFLLRSYLGIRCRKRRFVVADVPVSCGGRLFVTLAVHAL